MGLTGMDLIRLGLERGKTARQALNVITSLLEEYGQFGSGIPTGGAESSYNNSFIIADPREAWILETAGRHWAAKRYTQGLASISNTLSLESDYDLSSINLEGYAIGQGWWPKDKSGRFQFKHAFIDLNPDAQDRNKRSDIRASCSLNLLTSSLRIL